MIWSRRLKLDSGDVSFTLPNGEQWNVDLLVLKLTAQDVEESHGMKDGGKVPLEFLVDLCEALEQLGCKDCTPTLANQIWRATGRHFARLDSNFRNRLARSVR